MDSSTALTYTYVRAAGELSKSFVGNNAQKLFGLKSPQQVWSMLFNTEVPAIPESMLCQKLEENSKQKFIEDYKKLLNAFDKPPMILRTLLLVYDIENLKAVVSTLSVNKKPPKYVDLGKYAMFDFTLIPDLKRLTQDTPFNYLESVPTLKQCQNITQKIDCTYAKLLLDSAMTLQKDCKKAILDFLVNEYTLRNILWALRLKIYYNMAKEDIEPLLIKYPKAIKGYEALEKEALDILDKDTDTYSVWKDWKYQKLLNPYDANEVWQLDPRWFFHAAKKYLNHAALQMFHKYAQTPASLFSWFKVKHYELDHIRTVSEGIRLNVADEQIKKRFFL